MSTAIEPQAVRRSQSMNVAVMSQEYVAGTSQECDARQQFSISNSQLSPAVGADGLGVRGRK
jgi:hypothetical protein